jgi:hypothetical protein
MKNFSQLIKELSLIAESKTIRLPWNGNPTIGWWQSAKILRMYHGTNLDNLESFAREGLNRPDPRTKLYSLAFEPFTARAFAVMGGEARFLTLKSKALTVPENKRAVIVFDIPQAWINEHKDEKLGGNDPACKQKLLDKSIYDEWKESDQQYYQLCELRVKSPIPPKYMSGYMLK